MKAHRNKSKASSQGPSQDRVAEDTPRPVETSPAAPTVGARFLADFLSGEVEQRAVDSVSREAWAAQDQDTYDLCARVRTMRLPLDAKSAAAAVELCRSATAQAASVLTALDSPTEDEHVAALASAFDTLGDAQTLVGATLDALRPASAPARTSPAALDPATVRELEELVADLEGDALRNHEDDLALCALEIRRFLRTPGIDLLWLLSGAVAKVTDCNLEWAKSKLPNVAVPSAVQSARAANALRLVITDICPKAVIS